MLQLFTFNGTVVKAEGTTTTSNPIKIAVSFPENNFSGVPITTPIYFEFDRSVTAGPGVGSAVIKDKNGSSYPLQYEIQDYEAVFYLNNTKLLYSSAYTVTIPKNAVVDAEGNFMENDYVANFTTDQEYTVLGGKDRYETSLKISQEGWPEHSDYAILATGANFPDALSAGPLAAKYTAPILLVRSKELDAALEQEIDRLAVKNIFIVGGTGVVSQTIEDALKAKEIVVTRLNGNNRYETSVAIAKQLDLDQNSTVFLATGANFPDALSVAPIAAAKGMPIILTEKTKLPDATKQFFAETKISKVYVVGGYGAVALAPGQLTTTWEKRIEGSNRYETNLNVLAEFADELSFTYTFFATGKNFPDALAGSALAGLALSPVILVENNMPQNVVDELYLINEYMSHKYILGGEGVVPRAVVEKITE